MARKAAGHIDLGKTFQLLNVIIHKVTGGHISSPVVGQPEYREDQGRLYVWDGSGWTLKATDSDLLQGQNSAHHLSRANHTAPRQRKRSATSTRPSPRSVLTSSPRLLPI